MHSYIRLSVLIAAFAAVGCGPSAPTTVKVSGTVTFDGKPLEEGRVTFISMAEKDALNRPAIGVLGKDGKYALSTFQSGDGALPGEYQVVVVSNPDIPSPEEIAENDAEVVSAIPGGYASPTTSGLKATVKDGGDMTIDFDLKTGAVADEAPKQDAGPAVDQFGI